MSASIPPIRQVFMLFLALAAGAIGSVLAELASPGEAFQVS
jgi:hypothetical protein